MAIRFAASEPCAKAAPGNASKKDAAAAATREGNRKPSRFIEELIVYLISLTNNRANLPTRQCTERAPTR
jgi:hypothetical protein